MAESQAAESLTQRLAIGRLTRAGVLDRGALQRTHERFALPPRTSALDRLHRRIESATPSNARLPLVRIDRSIATDNAPSMNPSTSALAGATSVSAPTSEAARSPGDEHAARQTPSISRSGEFIARRVANTPGLVAGSMTSGILKHGQSSRDAAAPHSPIVAGAASTDTLYRMAAPNPAGVQALATSRLAQASNTDSTSMVRRPASPVHVAAPVLPINAAGQSTSSPPAIARSADAMVWRKPEGSVQASVQSVASTPSVATSSISGVSESFAMSGGVSPSSGTNDPPSRATGQRAPSAPASTGGLLRVSAWMTDHAASPVVWRTPNPTSLLPTATALAGTASSPTIAAAPTQLVLRKAMASTTANQSAIELPSITPSPPQIVARTTDESRRHAHAGTSTSSYDWNIDWITEQVGRRLARRLEIERERMGARSWR
jgi:hypothetical protein